MTLDAQQRMIFGAMCIDEHFRNELFESPEVGVQDSYERVARLLRKYAETNGVVVDDSMVQNVLNVVRGPCRQAALDAFAAAKAAACPCWPC